MNMNGKIAKDIEKRILPYARPDSHFHLDFSSFIPGFLGDDEAALSVKKLKIFQDARRIFITPDNSLISVRRILLEEGRDIVLPTYGLQGGFIVLNAAEIPSGHAQYAAWLDGAQYFGKPQSLKELQDAGAFDLIIAGAAAVDRAGRRFGMGSHYLDMEWGIFAEAGLVRPDTSIVSVVHDEQIHDGIVATLESHVHADLVVTPTRVLSIGIKPRPTRLDWNTVNSELLNAPPIMELSHL